MKRIILLLILLKAFPGVAQINKCRIYSSKNTDDVIEQNGKRLKADDTIDFSKKFYINNLSTLLIVQDVDGRVLTIGFRSGHPQKIKSTDNKHSELYEFLLGNYIKDIKTNTVLMASRPWDMDFVGFFNNFSENPEHRMLILDQDSISIHSDFITFTEGQEFYACLYHGKDSVLHKIDLKNRFIHLNFNQFEQAINSTDTFEWSLKFTAKVDGKKSIYPTSPKIRSIIISKNELKSEFTFIADYFKQSSDAAKQMRAYVLTNYGKYDRIEVERLIAEVVKLKFK